MNHLIKSLQFIVLILTFILNVRGETTHIPVSYQVKGIVTDSITGKGITYVTITIQGPAGIVKRLTSDASGKFSFVIGTTGKYDVVFQCVGYQLRKTEIVMDDNHPGKDLGTILMIPGNVKIGEVTVVAQKPLIKTEADKLIYSMESDPESKTNTVLEMLRKVPLVTVDGEDNVMVKGSSSFKILLNGKNSAMLSQNTKEVLRSMPASSVRDIEVITNPSSKYEAEGATGIINIITNRKQLEGIMGNVNTGIDTRGGIRAGAYVSSKIKKLGFSVNFSHSDYRRPAGYSFNTRENFLSTTNRYTETEGSTKYSGLSEMMMGEASYEIDSLNLISMSFFAFGGTGKNSGRTITTDFDINRVLARQFENIQTSGSTSRSESLNIDYQRSFKKPDKTFTVSYKLDNMPRQTETTNEINSLYHYTSYHQKTSNNAVGREHTFQLDYFDPLTKNHQIEGGVKYILRQNISNSDILRLNETTAIWEHDLAHINDLDYNQHIWALYSGYLLKLKKISIKTGVRAEGTLNDGLYKSLKDTSFTNKLFNLVPYITLSKNLKGGQNIKFSYTQRLSRPSIYYLNPFYNNADPLNVRYGNPKLDAEISHSFDFTYGKFSPKFNFNLNLSSLFTDNSITSITTIRPNGVSMTTYQNIGKNQRFGAYLYGSVNPGKKLSLNTNFSLNYSILESNNILNLRNQGFSYNGFISARYNTWKNAYLSINGGVFSSGIMLQGKYGISYFSSMSVSQEMFKKKLRVYLSVENPFEEKQKYESKFEDPTFRLNSKSYSYSRMARFTVYYYFGRLKDQIRKAKRTIKNDDLKSGGENSTGNN